jgi:ATP-dependent DNA ligase
MKTTASTLKKPMLLYKWEKQKKKIKYPCYVQPKYDGIRATWDRSTGKLYSRSGKVIEMPHITDSLKAFNALSLDAELCFEDFTVPLPEVIQAISRKDTDLKLMVFDNLQAHDEPFCKRFVSRVEGWFREDGIAHLDPIQIVATTLVHSEAEVDAYYEAATQGGMEGIIIRNADSPYQFGRRTMHTLKYKMEYEDYFQIDGYQRIPHPDI